jgi:multidrug transporter EmrE-like cation transporter
MAIAGSQQHVQSMGGRMRVTKILGIILLVAGTLGLFYGHFEYTKETHEGQFGPFKFSVAEKETAVIPSWASIAVIIAGVVLLVVRR